ncbi:FecR family protein [Aestuariivivens marinum]|uniref:FecR family protein n=1 Tax=Aestuariivivens marinum TaxID=2913555 RepID=UPI001F5AB829|nr:FecR family protein [Aestuariivivens marinum]
MVEHQIEILITKYFANQISDTELQRLKLWLKDDKNKILFQEYVDINYVLEQSKRVNLIEKEIVWRSINSKIKGGRLKSSYLRYAVAASVVLLLSISLFFNNSNNTLVDVNTTIVDNDIEIGIEKATLTLEDGTTVFLEKGQSFTTDKVTSNGEELIYNKKPENGSKKQIAYNYLTIPRGGIHSIVLNDGTKVWLNSDSKLKYPVAFNKGESRTVELIYGEAYFEVSPSSNHDGARFVVSTMLQEIEVLGTKFNIKAYNDDFSIYSTLIEGEVNISNGVDKVALKPGQQSIIRLNSKEKAINIIEADLSSEIAWLKGLFSFKNKSLKEISKVLSRWYDVDIIFEDNSIEDIKFKGQLSKNQNIEEILILIKNQNYINDYEIKDNYIVIK